MHEDARAKDSLDRAIGGVHNWSEHKKKAFRANHIAIAWHRLKRQGWFV